MAGVPGFLGNLESFHEASDFESAALRGFIAAWWEKHRSEEVGTKELDGIAGDLDLGGGCIEAPETRIAQCLPVNPAHRTPTASASASGP